MGLKSHKEGRSIMTKLAAIVREGGEGEQRWFCGGGLFTWKADSEETGGAFMMWEDKLDEGKVTPLHIHPDADETFYMLEGEVVVHIDGEERKVGPGGIAIFPRGVPHAFKVTSAEAKMLCFQNPSGGEAFYRLASEPVVPGESEPPADFDRIAAAAAQTGAIQILGPPPF
jgi:quercetin dioxygenase-like cupin family protein